MKIDVHNHFYPAPYLKELEKGDTQARLERGKGSIPHLLYAGDYNILVEGHRVIEHRLKDLDRTGIEMQVLTLTTPGVHIEERARGVGLAQIVNDAFSEIVKQYPDRFVALATLPLQDPDASVRELERAVTKLGLKGAMVFTNVNGHPLNAPHFWPLYEKAAELEVPIMLHPTTPVSVEAYDELRLPPLVGFPFDTTIAVARLVLSGVLEKYPTLKLIAAHLGGAIPYLAERIDRGYKVYPEIRTNIPRPPSDYFKQIYMDTVAFDTAALTFALEFAGPDKLLLGSDYPHQIGDLGGSVRAVEALQISTETKEKILEANAIQLFKIKR